MRTGTLTDLKDAFFEYRRIDKARSTWKAELVKSSTVLRILGRKRIDAITRADIQDYVIQRKKEGLTNRTVNLELSIIRAMIEFAIGRGLAVNNVAKEVKNLREHKKPKRIPTDEEVQAFLAAVTGTDTSGQLVTCILLRVYTGMRPGETFNLTWEDIKFDSNLIIVRPTEDRPLKYGASRVIDMHPDLKTQLFKWKAEWDLRMNGAGDHHNNVFFQSANPEKTVLEFRKGFERAKRQAGLPWLTPYILRDFFISKCIMAGVDTFTTMKWVGHRSSKMIDEVYGQVYPSHTAEQMEKLSFGGVDG